MAAACAVTLSFTATPAQAISVQTVDYTPWGGVELRTVVLFGGGSFEYFSYVQFAENATEANSCIVTGWATMSNSSSTWETPRVLKSCTPALKDTTDRYQVPDFFDTLTSATAAIPHVCITLGWSTGATRQQCYAGTVVRA